MSLNYEKSECINLKNCALGGSIILSTGGSIFVSAEGPPGCAVLTGCVEGVVTTQYRSTMWFCKLFVDFFFSTRLIKGHTAPTKHTQEIPKNQAIP